MAATDPTGVAGKLRVLESRVLVCYSDKGGGADKLSGEHAPRHAAATLVQQKPAVLLVRRVALVRVAVIAEHARGRDREHAFFGVARVR